ncbi:hypothetical protein BY996DRAFT_6692376 [Phakopsora pachyrhizi]|nr:hypothetical protein BY996DRAFT_6692376 [Phakopsora pachyrhizi]
MTCSFYTGANTSSATCNDQPNVVCTKGCTGTFVTATQCTPVNGPEGTTPSTQVCSIGFGRDTARAKGKRLQEPKVIKRQQDRFRFF